MIEFRQKGDFKRLTKYLERAKESVHMGMLDKYAKEGVAALKSATPRKTGKTADSWYNEIKNQNGVPSIIFKNSNIIDNVPIAIILQYGHATQGGVWVEGRDYINPVIQPLFDKIVEKAWTEVTKT